MAGLLNIGITGLNAAQSALVTTGHNISNAATEGYSRQSVVLGTQQPLFRGSFFGQGTQVESVRRSYNAFLEGQVLTADSQRAQFATYSTQIAQLDNLLADPDTGLSPALQSFFDGVQEVSANPSSVPARQSMISAAQSLVATFQYLDGRMSEIRDGIEGQIGLTVAEINAYASEIADINQRIAVTESAGTGQQANDLRDQRDTLIRELNGYVKLSTVTESDGSVSVFVGSGQPLVIGTNASTLVTLPSKGDPSRSAIALQTPGGGTVTMPESLLEGGQLGGLLAFRRDSLDAAQKQLGLVAAGLPLASTRSTASARISMARLAAASSVSSALRARGGRCHQRCLRGLATLRADRRRLPAHHHRRRELHLVASFRRSHGQCRRGRPRHYARRGAIAGELRHPADPLRCPGHLGGNHRYPPGGGRRPGARHRQWQQCRHRQTQRRDDHR